jgi:hypothetical protein
MSRRTPILAAALLLSTGAVAVASDCTRTSVGLTPLDDLGTGTYQGQEGGLYPGGTNIRPPTHDADLARVGTVQPLDPSGSPDPVNGTIVLLSIGMSNTTQEWQVFLPAANAYPFKNPKVTIVDGAQGGQDATIIANPAANFWTVVDQRLTAAGVTPQQVESVWLKQAVIAPSLAFPNDAIDLQTKLESIVQIIKTRYPNTLSVYLSSRIYAGYASTTLNPEPYSYHSGFSVQWLIRDQLNADPALNFDPGRGPVRAPWLSWGPYLWADGLIPRSDGLTWDCADFASDGTHPAPSGRIKVANLLLGFFPSDPTTSWFLDCPRIEPPETTDLQLVKLPSGQATMSWQSFDPTFAPTVYDIASGSVSALHADRGYVRAWCLTAGVGDSPITTSDPVPVSDATWYQVRGRNSCRRGIWGSGLDASTLACP